MAGHSQFSNIMHRKGAQDKKRAKIFAKLIREVTVAAKTGMPDPDANPRLRSAIVACRAANMPKENIDRAIKKVAGGDNDDSYDEIRYEGYGPGGSAIIVEALTDNRNRTASDVRTAFAKNGGNLGETGAVSFMFSKKGLISYPFEIKSTDDVFEAALSAGAEDVISDQNGHNIYCSVDELHIVADNLTSVLGDPDRANIVWHPQNTVKIDEINLRVVFSLIEALEDNDDVQRVFSNIEFPADFLSVLTD